MEALQINSSKKSPGMIHDIAIPTSNDVAAEAAPKSSPLRQKIYEFDIDSPHVHEGARHIFKNPSDNSTLSIIDTPIKNLRGVFKVTCLTPEMSQFAKLPCFGGRLLPTGGVNFLPYGDNNVKRSFFTFKFDGDYTTDEHEIKKMETVEVIKEAFLSHGSKTFRGSLVVNLDISAIGLLERRLNISFRDLTPVQKKGQRDSRL